MADIINTEATGAATDGVRTLLRLEGLTLRALGYGLKYQAGFSFTHLGRIGKDAAGAG